MLSTIGIILVLGVFSQWLGWRFKIPAIIVLLVAGFIVGPIFGIIDPIATFGRKSIISIVEILVAIILFDGAMQLKLREFKIVADGLKRVLTLGLLLHFTLLYLAAFYLVSPSIGLSALMGSILIVTGPTVIIPALREAKLNRKISHYLKWEGIVSDPIGALLAVVVYDMILLSSSNSYDFILLEILKIILISILLSISLKEFVSFVFSKNRLPHFLKLPLMTAIVMGSFILSNEIQHGSGLLTVTMLGILIGNSKIDSLQNIKEFKENITTISVSFVFILITSCIGLKSFLDISYSQIVFIVLASFILRPIAMLLSTLKSSMSIRERILMGSYAPRGIVAVSISAALCAEMKKSGLVVFAEQFLPTILLVVITTVICHSLYLQLLSRILGLSKVKAQGVVIVGTMPWVKDFAKKLNDLGIPVLITSASWHKLAPFRRVGVPTFYGRILDYLETFDFSYYSNLITVSENDSFNTLCCDRFSKVFGKKNVHKIKQAPNFIHDKFNIDKGDYCVYTNNLNLQLENLLKYHKQGWKFKHTKITENYTFEEYCFDNSENIMVMKISKDGNIEFGNKFYKKPKAGDLLISFTTPHKKINKYHRKMLVLNELIAC